MTQQEKRELNEELAVFAGWHWERYEVSEDAFGQVLLAPYEHLIEGHIGYIPPHEPNFVSSPDACSEWLIPEVLKRHSLIETMTFRQESGLYYTDVSIWDKAKSTVSKLGVLKGKLVARQYVEDQDPKKATALAICLAVKESITG